MDRAQWDEAKALATSLVLRSGIYVQRNGKCVCGAPQGPAAGASVWTVPHTADCPIQQHARLEGLINQARNLT